ncbi:GspE/PulE family protein [Heyndrickxia sporothermodurans]|uniref:competence type IV pilus ATPase ComGA n=1 Tax=Heyndrickxia sporothermodurans TaxID=46224 RepID=UPI002DB87DB7|nr:competence type IV pilus ATPase ComGA [Heyndrickxia sporothermodurans]MEB6547515.1 GspE/PulE family protein [Heyndrickxia sporothermodurans]
MTIEKIADLLLDQALKLNATDVHIIPRKDDYHVQLRFNGRLTPYRELTVEIGERLISHFKFMSAMDISEKRKPQSGSFHLFVHQKKTSLRISTLPTALLKESLVIRILPQNQSVTIDEISLFPTFTKKLKALLMHSHGMVIFTGPTGSGKSTTMYTLVEHCSNQLKRNVITLEDPVEQQNSSFLQVQVNEKAGITYSTGLKAILRHDPDIIMVGEIRDSETAKIAIRAALTGHLVLSTLHTRDAKGAIYRLLEFGVQWHEIEQTLIAVTAQRLVKLKCPFCGNVCSTYCRNYIKKNRTAVYEMISGKTLKNVLSEANGNRIKTKYKTLKEIIRKGIALGYISTNEYYRWVFDEEEESNPYQNSRNVFE